MSAVFILLSIVLLLALFICTANQLISKGFITLEKGFFIPKELRDLEVLASVVIFSCLYALGMAALYGASFGYKPQAFALVIIFTIALCTTALSANLIKRAISPKGLSTAVNYFLGFGGLIISWIGGTFASAYIEEQTNLSASEMPSAVLGLTLLYAPILWNVAASVCYLALYLIVSILIIKGDSKSRRERAKHSLKDWRNQLVLGSLSLGLAFSAMASLNVLNFSMVFKYLKDTERFILIFSGYPLNKHQCALNSAPEDRFAILSSGDIAVAKYIDETKTDYFKIKCETKYQEWNIQSAQPVKSEGR